MKNKSLSEILPALFCIALCQNVCAQFSPFKHITITNPTPQANDEFGSAVGAVGDNVIIGAYQDNTGASVTGAAYLFDRQGTLLTTFTNPTPGEADIFGVGVAGVGPDKVIIGASHDDTLSGDAGAAYLFNTNGTLLRSFFPPMPGGGLDIQFGNAVAGVGANKILIGAYKWEPGLPYTDSGAAYLFNVDGTLETTFTNPAPANNDWFGWAVAPVGADKVVISKFTKVGAAYLYTTNGTLLTTITNPIGTEYEYFGHAVAVIGTDRILVGAYGNNTGASGAGVAYLFNLRGQLITTFTNPVPTANSFFGYSVAGLGADKVLISAINHANSTGIAYIFNTNRTLLSAITNPTPAAGDGFGFRMAPIGTDQAIITSWLDDAGAMDAGAAHIFFFPPSLAVSKTSTNTLVISWPATSTGFVLQENMNLNSGRWSEVAETVNDDGTRRFIVVETSAASRFYRLFAP